MIAQIICHGMDRRDTITKLLRYLGQVKIEGICTNISLLRKILKDKVFRDGIYDTTFIKGFMERTDARELIAEIDAAAGAKSRTVDIDSLRIDGSDELKVIAPSTGVFYLSPSPKDPAFVAEGSVVSTDDSLCLLEAMKVFRALNLDRFNSDDATLYETKKRYRIERIIPANGTAVSRGDLLFVVRPV
jgi:acetyl/propionyl-CoA carboxylase alpha subunit